MNPDCSPGVSIQAHSDYGITSKFQVPYFLDRNGKRLQIKVCIEANSPQFYHLKLRNRTNTLCFIKSGPLKF